MSEEPDAAEFQRMKEETIQQFARLFDLPERILRPLPDKDDDPDRQCQGRMASPVIEDAGGYCRCTNPACLFRHS